MPKLVNVLIGELRKTCQEHLLAEKWLLAPSLRAGHAWLMTAARSGQPVVNAHVKTVTKLALDLAGPMIAEHTLDFASAQQRSLLVDQVIQRLRKPDEGYLLRLPPSVRLSETVFKAIDAMRLAGLDSKDLPLERFEVDVKGREIRDILTEYTKELKRRRWLDRAGVLELATGRLKSKDGALASDVLVLVPADLDVSGLERQLLDALPAVRRIRLQVDEPAPHAPTEGGSSSDARLLRWLPSPAEAPPPAGDGSARIFRAVGEVNEVRGVLRRCLADKIPLDEVEVLCTDVDTYVPLIYETFAALLPGETNLDKIPVTFHEGIPARKFRPGRVLVAWLAWARNDYPQSGLVAMIQEGLLNIPGYDPDAPGAISFGLLAAIFRTIGIGFGATGIGKRWRNTRRPGSSGDTIRRPFVTKTVNSRRARTDLWTSD